MAKAKSRFVIRSAGMSCLAGCIKADAPFTFLRDFEEQLRKKGWSEADVKAVSMEVLPTLVIHVNRDRSDAGDANVAVN